MEHETTAARRANRRQRFLESPLPVLFAFVAIGLLAWANFHLLVHYPELPAWLPAGAGLGLMLLLGPRIATAMVAGTAVGLVAAGAPLAGACLAALLGSAACLLTWALLIKVRPVAMGRLSVGDTGRMLLSACAVFAATGFLEGSTAVALLAGGTVSVAQQVLSDALGVMLVAPLLAWLAQPRAAPVSGSGSHWLGALATFIVLGVVTLAVYGGTLAHRFSMSDSTLLVLPPALWLALRYPTGYTLAGNFMIVLAAGIGTSRGYGPFAHDSAGLPLTLAVIAATTLLVAASRAECRRAEATIARLATHDGLTGVANRRAFSERMEHVLDAAARDGRQVALMFIDLSHFKQVNDKLGHQVGDMLLAEAARRILGCIRSDAMLGRFGDDEFVVMVDHAGNRDALGGIAGRIASAVTMPYAIGGHACQIGCALGISVFPRDGVSVADLVRKSDAAMYQLKSAGLNGYRFYTIPREREMTPETVE